MTSDWKECKIGDVVSIRRGASPRPIHKYLSKTGMPWVKIADATSELSRYLSKTNEFITLDGVDKSVLVEPGTLIISNSATPGLPKIMKITACVHDGWLVFSNYNGVLRDFLYYKFMDIQKQLLNQANGSVFQNLKTNIVKEFNIYLPSLKEQERIVKTLGAIDDKIELNNKINENLEQQAKAIFKSWFVDFKPFGGIMPKKWSNGILGDIVNICSGKRPLQKEDYKTTEFCIPIIGASSIMGYTNKHLYNNKILITGRVGTHGVIQKVSYPCWASDNTLVITSKYYEFTYQILKTIDYNNLNRGSTQPLITQTDLKNVKIIVPDAAILNQFEVNIGRLMKLKQNLLNENETLTRLRDMLLPKLMNGEIDVLNLGS